MCCMNVCPLSGRIVTSAKSLVTIWDCDLILRTYRIAHDKYIDTKREDNGSAKSTKSPTNSDGVNIVDLGRSAPEAVAANIVDGRDGRDGRDAVTRNPSRSTYRLGATSSRKQRRYRKRKVHQVVTVRTPPLKILSLHASFMVRLLYLDGNYLSFASDHEARMVYLDIDALYLKEGHRGNMQSEHHGNDDDDGVSVHSKRRRRMLEDYSSDEEDTVIIDIYDKSKRDSKRNSKRNSKWKKGNDRNRAKPVKPQPVKITPPPKSESKKDSKEKPKGLQQQQSMDTQEIDLSDTDSDATLTENEQTEDDLMRTIKEKGNSSSTMRNVAVVFDDDGCPSVKHHAASFMLIPSIYEFNRFVESKSTS